MKQAVKSKSRPVPAPVKTAKVAPRKAEILTKREHFASEAEVPEFMIQLFASAHSLNHSAALLIAKFIARVKVEIADALLIELSK